MRYRVGTLRCLMTVRAALYDGLSLKKIKTISARITMILTNFTYIAARLLSMSRILSFTFFVRW
jgi:hypothetical protein